MDVEKIKDGIAGVYRITCKKNNKNYIGVSKNIVKRWKNHISLLRSGRHHSIKLQEDYDRYGEDFFEFRVVEISDSDEAKKLEDKYIKKYQSDINGYNHKNHSDNIKYRDKVYRESILEYIKESYKPDENTYCYDFFNMAKYLNITPSEFMKFLGLNVSQTFNIFSYLSETTIIGLNWSENNIFIEIIDKNLYSDEGNFIEVDVSIF